ncbi:hypothetical protein Clacol_000110 [Clathrus columnatus]|uniref:C2H2-type domain-containing protein n=1 Tax=Clathrus columnatus TaxID=1419009 RepID=A0AAV4ZZV5_9AGAM|nr:hypothetical protein Clacol_000110 [Clathrus columnatus]
MAQTSFGGLCLADSWYIQIIVEVKAKNNGETESQVGLQNTLHTRQDARTVSHSLSRESITSEQSQDTSNSYNAVNNPPVSRSYGISAHTSVDNAKQGGLRREFHMGRDDQMSRNFVSKSTVPQYQDTPSLHNAVLNPQYQPFPQVGSHNVQNAQHENLKRKFQMNKGDQMSREQDAPKLHNAHDNQPTNGARGRSHSDPAHRVSFTQDTQQYRPQSVSSTGMISNSSSNVNNQWRQSQGGFELQNVTTIPNYRPLPVSGNYDTSAHQGPVLDRNAPQMRTDERMIRQHVPCQQPNPVSQQGRPSHGAYPKDTSKPDNVTPNQHYPPHYESWFHETSARKMFENSNAQHNGTKGNSYTVKDDRRFGRVPQSNQIGDRGQQSHSAHSEQQDTPKLNNVVPDSYNKPSSRPLRDNASAPGEGHLVPLPLNNVPWRSPPVPVAQDPIKKRLKVGRKLKDTHIGKPHGDIKSTMILGRTPASSYPHLNQIIIPSLPTVRIRSLEPEGPQSPSAPQAGTNPQAPTPMPMPTPMINLDDDPDVPGLYKKTGNSTWICTYIKRGHVCNREIFGKRFRDRHVGTHANREKAMIEAGTLKLEDAIALPRLRTLVYECDVPDCPYFLKNGTKYRYENYRVDGQKAAHIKKFHKPDKGNGSDADNEEEVEKGDNLY